MGNGHGPRWAREFLLQAILLLALLAAVFPGFFLRGERITAGDLLYLSRPWDLNPPPDWDGPQNRVMSDVVTAFMPYYAATQLALDAGQWPLWNPLELGGMPLLANMQSTVLYPPRQLHAFLDLHVATSLFILFKLWLCGMTAYLCGRALGLGIGASRFFSVAWMLAGYNVVWAYWSLTDVSAWLPVVFLGTEYALQGRVRRGVFTTALGGALILMAGHPETAFAMSVGAGLYFLLRLAWDRRRGRSLWRPVAIQAGGWALGLLLCAALLLPFIEYLLHSYTYFSRALDDDTEAYYNFGALISFWVPRFFGTTAEQTFWGWELVGTSNPYMALYSGMVVWLGALLLLTGGEVRERHRGRIAALTITAAIMTLLAFNAPPLDFINRLPVIRTMILFYHAAFVIFALPLLGAIGLEHWFSRPRRLRELAAVLPAVVVPAVLAWLLLDFHGPLLAMNDLEPLVRRELTIAAAAAAASLLVLGAGALRPRPRLWTAAATLVLAVDLLVATRGMSPTLPPAYVYPDTELTQYLQELEKPVRIGAGEGGIVSGLLAPYRVEEMLGYDGLYPARIVRFQEALGADVWKAAMPLLSIRYYLHDPRYEPLLPKEVLENRLELVAERDGLEVYRDPEALDRAFVVPEAEVVPEARDQFERMRRESFDPARVALVEEPLPQGANLTSDPISGARARVVEHTPNRVVVEAETPRAAMLVLADAYYPGWRARIDDGAAEIFPVYTIWRGVVLPEGRHTVVFEFRPLSVRVGLALSVAACLGTLVYAVGLWRRRPRLSGGGSG